MADVFGPLLSTWQIEQAVLGVLKNIPPSPATAPRIVYYLAEVERQTSLAAHTLPIPPGPSSYRGGLDANTLEAEWFPILHVIVKPTGEPEAIDMHTYGQEFQIQVVSTAGDDNEDTARMVATSYGIAVAGCIQHYGSLGINATNTVIARTPDPELLNAATARQVARSTVTFSTFIAPVLYKTGPISWPADPYAASANWPTITTVNTTTTAD